MVNYRAMRHRIFIAILLILNAFALNAETLRTAESMERIPFDMARRGVPFEIVGKISGVDHTKREQRSSLFFRDNTGSTVLQNSLGELNADIRSGDLVKASGCVVASDSGIYAKLHALDLIRHLPPEKAVNATIGELLTGKMDCQRVTVRGNVTAAFADEVDPSWTYLVLSDGPNTIYAPVVMSRFRLTNGDDLVGANLELSGWCTASSLTGARQHLGRFFVTARDGLRILSTPRKGIFDVATLEDCRQLPPAEIARLGRRKLFGTVIAAGGRESFLLRAEDGRIVRVDLARPPMPAYGETVEAVGVVETDLYHVNLSAASWRHCSSIMAWKQPPPESVSPQSLFLNDGGQKQFNIRFHGRPIRLRGIVRSLPHPKDTNGRIYLEADGFLIPLDFSRFPDSVKSLEVGCVAEASGTCVLESDNWRPNSIFPSIKGIVLVGRTAEDLQIVAQPPWWTPMKLLVVIGALVLVLAAIVIWNISLRVLAERRGQELNRETIARIASDLKVYERTRLAVELHDSIAQSLTGVSLEIKTAERLSATDEDGMHEHLKMANRTLNSCRQELRNCLWDLRNHALEQSDMDTAIRQTLNPVIGSAELFVRFSVPRELISDNTAHAILRIIRELATNAVRHGRATTIKVAGSIERQKLYFSVYDNGCGFDPESIPGAEEGHFGIQGIRERIADFNGSIAIESSSERGTKITVTVDVPHSDLTQEQRT